MKCNKCKTEIPQKRVDLGYTVCVDCSTTESYGCVDIVYHKTGNTVQPMDKSTAEQINKLSKRSGFGIMRGMMSGKTQKRKVKLGTNIKATVLVVETEDTFNKIGEVAVSLFDQSGKESAMAYLSECVKDSLVSWRQYTKLSNIIYALAAQNKQPVISKPVYNAYGKFEPKIDEPSVFKDSIWK